MVSLCLSKVHNSDESNPISCRTTRSTSQQQLFPGQISSLEMTPCKYFSHNNRKKGFLHCFASCSQPNCPCPNISTIQLCRDTQTCKTSACPGDKCVEKLCGNSEQGLGGAAPLSRHSQTRGCDFQLLREVTIKPQMSPVWHWVCLNRDPFAFQVPAQQTGAKGKKRVINGEVVVLHCGTVGIQLLQGKEKALEKWHRKPGASLPHQHSPTLPLCCSPCPLHIPRFYWGRKLGQPWVLTTGARQLHPIFNGDSQVISKLKNRRQGSKPASILWKHHLDSQQGICCSSSPFPVCTVPTCPEHHPCAPTGGIKAGRAWMSHPKVVLDLRAGWPQPDHVPAAKPSLGEKLSKYSKACRIRQINDLLKLNKNKRCFSLLSSSCLLPLPVNPTKITVLKSTFS